MGIKPIKPASYLLSCNSISSEGLETHKVQTDDGYILTLFRIVNSTTTTKTSKNGITQSGPRKAVLLVHGFLCDGTEWLLSSDLEKTLPKMLVREGYDCWMGCLRGTTHSKSHVNFTPKSKKFWDFSVDEMGKFDIPTMIDYILKLTGNSELYYIGHSMGCVSLFVTMNLRPEYKDKIRVMAALAPGVYAKHVTKLLLKFVFPFITFLTAKSKFVYRRPIGSTTVHQIVKKITPRFLKLNEENIGGWIIKTAGHMSGPVIHDGQTDKEGFNRLAKKMPSSSSIKHATHIVQCHRANSFQAFDYGRSGNLKRYGQPTPLKYDLGKVKVPVATFTASCDYLIPAQDVAQVAKELPNLISHYEICQPKFTHCDFLVGREADKILYQQVIDVFGNFDTTNTTL